jgi:enoyl-CoA hydratase/3-hydroxyacyl-CoA dehydrogenase
MNEAAWIVESGDATIETVDSTTKFDMGLPMGSFELADQVGIDVGYHVLEYMHEVLGEAYRPCPLLVEKVEAEELGKKTGSGFYDYENGGAEIPTDAIDADVRKRLLAAPDSRTVPQSSPIARGSPNSSTSSTTFTRRRARSATRRPTSSARPPRRGASTVTRAPTPTERPTATHSPLTTPSTSPSRTASATSRSTARTG